MTVNDLIKFLSELTEEERTLTVVRPDFCANHQTTEYEHIDEPGVMEVEPPEGYRLPWPVNPDGSRPKTLRVVSI